MRIAGSLLERWIANAKNRQHGRASRTNGCRHPACVRDRRACDAKLSGSGAERLRSCWRHAGVTVHPDVARCENTREVVLRITVDNQCAGAPRSREISACQRRICTSDANEGRAADDAAAIVDALADGKAEADASSGFHSAGVGNEVYFAGENPVLRYTDVSGVDGLNRGRL